jgi:hypothetical protein
MFGIFFYNRNFSWGKREGRPRRDALVPVLVAA